MEMSEIREQRISKLNFLKEKGIEPYAGVSLLKRIAIAEVTRDFKEEMNVEVCGRVIAKRLHGKVVFCDLRDATGKIQIYLQEASLGKEKFSLFDAIEVADIIAVKGSTFKTRMGEPTIKVGEFNLLSKALRPLPEKWHGLKDIESRFRQRYLDILSNKEVREIFLRRSQIVRSIREFLNQRGYLEVETPMLHSIAGGARGRPFKTYHNEYELELFLRIAPELYLKRLLVAGFERVYEINRSFRNEGVSTRHNPEFTMLEAYTVYSDCRGVMKLTEELFRFLAKTIFGKEEIVYQDTTIDLTSWQEVSFAEEMKKRFNIEPQDRLEVLIEKLKKKGVEVPSGFFSRSFVLNLIADLIETKKENPVFVVDLFTELCPLAKRKPDNPYLSERFELFIGGLEVANAYSELNDPLEQRRRFEEELKDLPKEEKKSIDQDFLLALEHGMPPAGGLGVGIDRLVMLFCNQPSIREVILFPLLRPIVE